MPIQMDEFEHRNKGASKVKEWLRLKIKWINSEDKIIFSPKTLKELLLSTKKLILKIGQWEKELDVGEEEAYSDEIIGLPLSISKMFTVPTNLNFEIKVTGGTLILGPVIGMIASQKHMNPQRLNKFLSRFNDYKKINGLIFIFSSSGVNQEKGTIGGYYYNPEGNGGYYWEEGIFPYPAALYKRLPIKKSIYQHLKNVIGEDRIFNSYHFTKWELWDILPDNSKGKSFLPYTEKFINLDQVERFTKRFREVYLKPQSGSGGIGIKSIHIDKSGFKLINHFNDIESFNKLEDMWEKIQPFTKKGYLIQQGIEGGINNRHVDFRAYMQKNGSKEWECPLIITRFSKVNEISTNLKYLDHLYTGKEGIQKLFEVNEAETLQIETKMKEACTRLCRDLDTYVGNYGDLAIDLMVDHNRNIWIIEVNTKTYGYASFRKLHDKSLFIKCKAAPFLYAKALAGF